MRLRAKEGEFFRDEVGTKHYRYILKTGDTLISEFGNLTVETLIVSEHYKEGDKPLFKQKWRFAVGYTPTEYVQLFNEDLNKWVNTDVVLRQENRGSVVMAQVMEFCTIDENGHFSSVTPNQWGSQMWIFNEVATWDQRAVKRKTKDVMFFVNGLLPQPEPQPEITE